ncbi:hypothetical protein A8C32_11860 [Flavivirga aquatica]|uniref:Outer membrane protein beta-barrel domain-containing protein n=1 Tax=Flavivirga aquatica TaxID=1849968 RepID=A0A1E5TDI7_9FLAO|nr:DUF6646 family protein [Flavivirga aquatica]OEK09407.1 hypothetical protein A8C32_11860 [Flavivirga aquatica]
MKNFILLMSFLCVYFVNSQAFKGKGDNKFQVGVNFQENATGLNVSYDLGVGENISLGFSSTYALEVENFLDADFGDRFDIKARFNANLGSVINIDDNLDIYPGLHVGLKNFGGHIGTRYFFTDGFGVYTELSTPFSKYNTDRLTFAEKLHNQFTVSLGAVFSL